jgi:hypothetical protein
LGLAQYAPHADFVIRPGSGRERNDREDGSTIQKENNLVPLNCQDYLGLLLLDVKNLSLDRRPQDPPFKGAI